MKKLWAVMVVTAGLLFGIGSSQAGFLDSLLGGGDSKTSDSSDKPSPSGSASDEANKMADKALYKPIEYINASRQGPVLVVIPGEIKSNNADFMQKFGPNNIADFAELELGRANFRVLERSDMGPLLKEFQLAYSMGDPNEAAKLLKKGKFKTTKWIVKFDILKAEPVAQAGKSFDGAAIGNIAGSLMGMPVAGMVGSSVKSNDQAKVWIVGLRYKIINAVTTEQKASGYVEDKMEIGAKGSSVLGVSENASGGLTLDSMVQRLVQTCVAEMDSRYKGEGQEAQEKTSQYKDKKPGGLAKKY